MIRFLIALLAVAVLGGGAAHAKTMQSETELRPLAERVMAQVAKGAFDEAGDTAKAYTNIPEEEMKTIISRVKLQMNSMLPRFGKAVGYEFIKEDRVGQSVIRLTFIAKHENHALPWIFLFYKSPNGWTLNQFFFNDNLNTLF